MRVSQLESLMWAGLGLGIIYVVIRWQRQLKAGLEYGGQVLETAQNRTANIIEYLFPLVNPNSMMTYTVNFPDGSRHAVPGESVNEAGYFLWRGAWYRLMQNADGQKVAVPK